jgi:hypothetical protein
MLAERLNLWESEPLVERAWTIVIYQQIGFIQYKSSNYNIRHLSIKIIGSQKVQQFL